MAPAKIDFESHALEDLQQAYDWYAKRSSTVAIAFLDEIDRAIALIADHPNSWATHLYGTRRFLLRKYPYVIIYRHSGDRVRVFAVAHTAKLPGYWRDRLG